MALRSSAQRFGVALAALCALAVVTPAAQTAGTSLGTVKLPQMVKANGQDPGTYSLRLTSDAVTPVVGQSPDAAQWVEFVQEGKVKGKEMATKVSAADVKTIAKMPPPAAGGSKVQVLKGADYVRIWLNRAGTHYLVHLAAVPK
jgi:hypothetical protein